MTRGRELPCAAMSTRLPARSGGESRLRNKAGGAIRLGWGELIGRDIAGIAPGCGVALAPARAATSREGARWHLLVAVLRASV